MASPTNYELEYPDPCEQEPGCGEGVCLDKVKENPRRQLFCEDVTFEKGVFIIPPAISVGGLVFKPTKIEALNGTFTVLATV